MNNPILQMLMGGQGNLSPQLMQLLQLMQNGGNSNAAFGLLVQQYPELQPLMQNNQLTPSNLEQFCRITCQQRGIDFNQIMEQAKQLTKQYNIK